MPRSIIIPLRDRALWSGISRPTLEAVRVRCETINARRGVVEEVLREIDLRIQYTGEPVRPVLLGWRTYYELCVECGNFEHVERVSAIRGVPIIVDDGAERRIHPLGDFDQVEPRTSNDNQYGTARTT